jgi:prepilin-type processing-associated H-X9-DG protein/prepilin-type N-terminal cleavage/methylation domain-containing protein
MNRKTEVTQIEMPACPDVARRNGERSQWRAALVRRGAFTLIEMLARPAVAPKHEERRQWRAAFTLIEMLVVIAIIALLATLTVAGVGSAIERAHKTACAANMKGLAEGMLQYQIEARTLNLPAALDQTQPSGEWAWSFRLVDAGVFPGYTNVGQLLKENEFFRCPSDEGPGDESPSFAINTYISSTSGQFASYRNLSRITNPASTILFAEVWGRRDNKKYTKVSPNDSFAAFERHNGSANYAFVDGHVKSLNYQKQLALPDNAWIDLWRPDL